jgi:hypothetical protein
VAAARVDADLGEAGEEPRGARDDAQVRGEGQVEARADSRPADCCDGRHADVADRREGLVDRLEVAVGLVLDGVESRVGQDGADRAGAEVLAPGDDDGADGRIGVGGPGCVDELA